MIATVVRNSTGFAVLFEMFWPTNMRSATPTEEISALSLNRLRTFESSGGIARNSACGNITYRIFACGVRLKAIQASCCSPEMDFNAPRNVSLVMAAMYIVREITTETYGGIGKRKMTGKQ